MLGIRTTIPFFVWLMRQAAYRDADYDTTWLDRLMRDRGGETFSTLDPEEETLVALAASVHTYLRASAAAPGGGTQAMSLWRRRRAPRRVADDLRNRDRRTPAGRVDRVGVARSLPDRRRRRRARGRRPSASAPSDSRSSTAAPAAAATITVAPAATGADAGELLVGLEGRLVAVSVDGRRRRGGPDGAAGGDGEQAVTAPMPGRVVRVLVAPGDTVAARQGVVVVEAMKMENELRTPKAGVVKDVAVTPGTLVEAGRVLVVVT